MSWTVQTGKAPISVATLLAIWSISLTVNLPGLAITPMLDSLTSRFPDTTELEVQLLTSLPNLLIIPFVLLSGKLSMSKSKVGLVVISLIIFLLCGIAYFFANSMGMLIVISCILGCGAGLLIPLAAGLLSDTFVGKYRMTQMGIKSGISNLALVIATFIVGWLSKCSNWHMPFMVYLIPAIPLALSPYLTRIPQSDLQPQNLDTPHRVGKTVSHQPRIKIYHGFYLFRIIPVVLVYFFGIYATMVVSYYVPFVFEANGLGNVRAGTVTAVFFFGMFIPGLLLSQYLRLFKNFSFILAAIMMVFGLGFFFILSHMWSYCVAVFFIGASMGVIQPLMYDKATESVVGERQATLALAITLAFNYLAIAAAPFIIDGIGDMLGCHGSLFAFQLNFVLSVIFLAVVIWKRNSFVFIIKPKYY